MRITQEADYAIRIVCLLAQNRNLTDAGTIAEKCCITQRFALKILHKLVGGKLIRSFKGAGGGYRLAQEPDHITLKQIIELIDGEIAISRCLAEDHVCSRSGENKSACTVHCVFEAMNRDLVQKLNSVTVSALIDPDVTAETIIEGFKNLT